MHGWRLYTGLTDDLIKSYEDHVNRVYRTCNTLHGDTRIKIKRNNVIFSGCLGKENTIQTSPPTKKDALIKSNFRKVQLLSQCKKLSHHKHKELEKGPDAAQPIKNPSTRLRAGILGGGQLGRMLLQAGANYPVETFVMENDPECPAAHLCHHFVKGDITNFDDVYNFGKGLDAITIEIESVNEDALEKLESEGSKIYPRPTALRIIKNKILQKQFYKDHGIPTSEFIITQNQSGLKQLEKFLPAVHKIGKGGYDGRGVQILKTREDFKKGFDTPSVLEKMVNIKKEISMIVAVNDKGETTVYPAVDMLFDQTLNLLEYQVSPADLPEKLLSKIEAIAMKVVKDLDSAGIFAVELFVDMKDNVYVNETAPRVHNSGHHTIEANYSSQFDMLWRIILGFPLGCTEHILPAAIVNLVGSDGFTGNAHYEGLYEILQIENVFVHIYGKKETRPGRKMGHITILGKERQELTHQANLVKQIVRVVSR